MTEFHHEKETGLNIDKTQLDQKQIDGDLYLRCPRCVLLVRPKNFDDHIEGELCTKMVEKGTDYKSRIIMKQPGVEMNIRAENISVSED